MSPQFFTVSGKCAVAFSLSVFRQWETLLPFCLVGFAPVAQPLAGPPSWQAHSPGHMVPVLPCVEQFRERGSFLRCYCFCSEFAKEYICVCVYIYVYIYTYTHTHTHIELLITFVLGKVLNEQKIYFIAILTVKRHTVQQKKQKGCV